MHSAIKAAGRDGFINVIQAHFHYENAAVHRIAKSKWEWVSLKNMGRNVMIVQKHALRHRENPKAPRGKGFRA